MKNFYKNVFKQLKVMMGTALLLSMVLITSCNNDDESVPLADLTGNNIVFELGSKGDAGVSGTVTFEERSDNTTKVSIALTGGTAGDSHPSHIHANTAAEGGPIVIGLTNVDGSTGKSETEVSKMDDGTTILYAELINFDGYVNVHKSETELSSLVSQGDIGQNHLTGTTEDYDLIESAIDGISGEILFSERVNGETLVTIILEGTTEGSEHPAHIHSNSVVEGGGIVISLNAVDGTTGMSMTNVSQMDDGTAITFSGLKEFDGHVKAHNSASDLGTVVAKGDIGINKLTGKSEEYNLGALNSSGISGNITFMERKSGAALVNIRLSGTATEGDYPAHIHANTAAEGGGIVISLSNVNGNGISDTHIEADNDGVMLSYDDLIEFNGYVNVHKSETELSSLQAQGDIGQNALTGESVEYALGALNGSGVSGTTTFAERNNGFTLITVILAGTTPGGSHPAHIHDNNIAMGGGIAIDLKDVNGDTGMSKTSVMKLNDGTEITYDGLTGFNGHIKTHESEANLGNVLAGGNIGGN